MGPSVRKGTNSPKGPIELGGDNGDAKDRHREVGFGRLGEVSERTARGPVRRNLYRAYQKTIGNVGVTLKKKIAATTALEKKELWAWKLRSETGPLKGGPLTRGKSRGVYWCQNWVGKKTELGEVSAHQGEGWMELHRPGRGERLVRAE